MGISPTLPIPTFLKSPWPPFKIWSSKRIFKNWFYDLRKRPQVHFFDPIQHLRKPPWNLVFLFHKTTTTQLRLSCLISQFTKLSRDPDRKNGHLRLPKIIFDELDSVLYAENTPPPHFFTAYLRSIGSVYYRCLAQPQSCLFQFSKFLEWFLFPYSLTRIFEQNWLPSFFSFGLFVLTQFVIQLFFSTASKQGLY